MILCESYTCNSCDCKFYSPIELGSDSATVDSSVYCPKCGSGSYKILIPMSYYFKEANNESKRSDRIFRRNYR